jgi:menaquinol-cytochrome c reductase cytochrome b/c subunit
MMAEDPGIDQETFDRLVAEGQPERVARAKAKAAAARKSRQAEASAGDGASADGDGASADGDGETPEQVQERVFNELVAQGQPERVARAKAKAAAARAKRTEEAAPAPARQPAAATAGTSAGAAAAGAGVVTGDGHGNGTALTPEQRQARVAAALAARAEGGPHERTGGTETKYAGQEHTHRLLAMVPPTGIQQIRGKQDDKAYTWPHLLMAEFVALMVVTVFLTVFSALAPAPLRELANPNVTPNPSKAPWYFLGLQEMLRYWHPMVSGVMLPLVWGPLGLVALPYLDRNPSMRPERRKFAYMMFTMFMVGSGMLTISGSFFRGPGFNWTWPWTDGIWFTL